MQWLDVCCTYNADLVVLLVVWMWCLVLLLDCFVVWIVVLVCGWLVSCGIGVGVLVVGVRGCLLFGWFNLGCLVDVICV